MWQINDKGCEKSYWDITNSYENLKSGHGLFWTGYLCF